MPETWGVLLGGGRSSRMGTDKLRLLDGDASLGSRAVDALLAVADRVIVSSPERADVARDGVSFVLEDPPFGGPVAGIAAALAAIVADDGEVYLLAGDLLAPAEVVDLLRGREIDGDGAALIDREGWPQYLAGRYRLPALREALAGEARDRSVHRTFRVLDLILVPAEKSVTGDVDTPEQAKSAGLRLPEPGADQP